LIPALHGALNLSDLTGVTECGIARKKSQFERTFEWRDLDAARGFARAFSRVFDLGKPNRRRGELRSPTRASFDLTDWFVTFQAVYAKNRRTDGTANP